MAVDLTVSKISSDQRSEESGHSEIHYNLLKMQFRTMELECILNSLPWQRFALYEWF